MVGLVKKSSQLRTRKENLKIDKSHVNIDKDSAQDLESEDMDRSSRVYAQRLANPSKNVRDETLSQLKALFRKRTNLSEMDMLKIWRGLFYSMWLCDKEAVQRELATNISKLYYAFGSDLERCALYLSCFFTTLKRDWSGLDQHRLDKYYMFIRLMVFELIAYFNFLPLSGFLPTILTL